MFEALSIASAGRQHSVQDQHSCCLRRAQFLAWAICSVATLNKICRWAAPQTKSKVIIGSCIPPFRVTKGTHNKQANFNLWTFGALHLLLGNTSPGLSCPTHKSFPLTILSYQRLRITDDLDMRISVVMAHSIHDPVKLSNSPIRSP